MRVPSLPGYEVGKVAYGDGFQAAVIFTCAECAETHAERFPGGGLSPEYAAKRARLRGWVVEPRRHSGNRCPACIARTKPPKKAAPASAPPLIPIPQETTNVVELPKPAPKIVAAPPRQPTSQDRVRIRGMLDKTFDDGVGCYLDGYSDQKIGEELKLPWSFVQEIREAAYGPIRVDPEIAGLRAQLVGLGTKIEALMKEQYALVERLAAIEKKRAA